MKVKQRKSLIWLFLKIHLRITISMESSRWDLSIDMVVDRFIFKSNKIVIFPCFMPKTGMAHPEKSNLKTREIPSNWRRIFLLEMVIKVLLSFLDYFLWEGRSRVILSTGEYSSKRKYFYFRVGPKCLVRQPTQINFALRLAARSWLVANMWCDRWPGGDPQPSRCSRPVGRPRLGRWTARPVVSPLYACFFFNPAPGLVAAPGISKVYSRAWCWRFERVLI